MKYLLIKYVSFFSNEEIMYKAFLSVEMPDFCSQPSTPAQGSDTHLSMLVFAAGTMWGGGFWGAGRQWAPPVGQRVCPARQRAQPFFHPREPGGPPSSALGRSACVFTPEEGQVRKDWTGKLHDRQWWGSFKFFSAPKWFCFLPRGLRKYRWMVA